MTRGTFSVDLRRVLLLLCGALGIAAVATLVVMGPTFRWRLEHFWRSSAFRYHRLDHAHLNAALGDRLLPGEPGDATNPPGEVLIIVLDTVRRDHLGLYTPGLNTSPGIDSWSEQARVFTSAHSTSSWTLPAHASLFTGLAPSDHGAHGLAPEDKTWDGFEDAYALPDGTPTLASTLRLSGYTTVGIASNQAYLTPAYKLNQGFDSWLCGELEPEPANHSPSARRVTDLATSVLERPRSEPLLLFLNYMDAHTPYRWYGDEPQEIGVFTHSIGEPWLRRCDEILTGERPMTADEHQRLVQAYDGEIRYLDSQLGPLLERLPELGIDHNDFVVVTSDHGEYLGEQGLVEHSKDLHEPVLAIPLMVRGPGYSSGRDHDPIQLSDLPTLILEGLGMPPLPGSQARDDFEVAELYYSRHKDLEREARRAQMYRIRRTFLHEGRKIFTSDGRCEEAYDLTIDPGELQPAGEAAWRIEICGEGRAWQDGVQTPKLQPPGEVQTSEEQLRALGYL